MIGEVNALATRKRPRAGQPEKVIAMNDDSKIDVESDSYFAMIPEWVMYSGVSKSAIMVYLVLNRYANKKSWTCYPSRETIIQKAQISKNTLDKCFKELVDVGALIIEKRRTGHGVYASNLYTVCMLPPSAVHAPKIGTTHTPDFGTTHTPEISPLTIVNNQSQRTREIYSSTTTKSGQPAVYDSDTQKYLASEYFDEFWKIYPRKVGKGQARTAFVKALKKGLIGEILEGCQKYADQRKDQDPAYTAHPATWLNAERWLDEPDPTFTPKNVTRADQTDKVKAALQRLTTQQREITA